MHAFWNETGDGPRLPVEDRGAAEDEPKFQLEPPAISLPKGGGAIKGLDEKFRVNPSNGTLSLSLPLPFTRSRNDAVPPVRLAYDGGSGNSVAGIGWSLDVPSIRRRTDRFIPRYDGNDRFLMSGADELVPALRWDGATWVPEEHSADGLEVVRYRPRVDSDFSRVERISDGAATWWRVCSRDNVTTFYGTDAGARIADPDAQDRVLEWLPTISFDDVGNCVVYGYKAEDMAGVPATACNANRRSGLAKFANLHLKDVRYGNRTPYFGDEDAPYAPAAPAGEFLFHAVFDYGEHDPDSPEPSSTPRTWATRGDAFSSHRGGFEVRTQRLLRRVLMFHCFDELTGGRPCLVRSLDLTHDAAPGPAGEPQAAEVTLLTGATQSGYIPLDGGGYSKRSLPPMTFEYQRLEWDTTVRRADRATAAHSAPVGIGHGYQLVDLYGEGIAGVFSEQGGAWRYAANLGDVEAPGELRLAEPRVLRQKPSFNGMATGTLELQDLDADGRKQVVVRSPHVSGYFELEPDRTWAPMRAFPSTIRVDLADRHVRMLDLVGDGRADLLVADDEAFLWYRSKGTDGFAEMERAPRSADGEASPDVVFADRAQAVLIGDMTGDGLADIVRIRNRDVSYWPNRGYGRFGPRVQMDGAPAFDHPDRFDARHVRMADITGTGATDLLYLGRDGCAAYVNLSGNAWGERQQITRELPAGSPHEVATADLLGNGTTCLVWSSPLPGDRDAPLRYIDLMGRRKPHLLRGFANQLGKEVEFEYASSARHYLQDKLAGRRWATRLPFPVHVVERVEVRDRIAAATRVSTYRYHHGHYDHDEREFRGFGMVEQRDAERFEHWERGAGGALADRTVHQPPVLTKTWFHTGADLGPDALEQRFRDEHWDREMVRAGFAASADEPRLPHPAVADSSPVDVSRADHRREARRACRGTMLRQEVFALDAPSSGATDEQRQRELAPYTVTSQSPLIEFLQPAADGEHAVVTVKTSEQLTLNYDREPTDPRIEHTLNVAVDEQGNVIEAATVTYGRRVADASLPAQTLAAQARTVVTYVHNEFTNDAVGPLHHRLRRPSRATTFEITGLPRAGAIHALGDFRRAGFSVLADSTEIPHHDDEPAAPPGGVVRRMLARKETVFHDAALTGPAPLHHIEPTALPFESYELALTPGLVTTVYGTRVSDAVLAEGRYVHRGDASWWVPSGRWEYLDAGEAAAAARSRFFTHVAHRDAHGARTTIGHLAAYHLLRDETVDAAGNRTRVEAFDLRALSPRRLVDPNENISEVLLDELGRVKATAVRGKGAEADDLSAVPAAATAGDDAAAAALFAAATPAEVADAGALLLGNASARHVYDVDRYALSGGTQPPAVATIMREQHAAVRADSPLQVSFEYSNGGGRVELRKVPAEPGLAKRATVQPDGTVTVDTVDTSPQPRWLGTGRKIVNNKGNVVKEYEPFFAVTHRFESEKELVESGVTRIHYYDPVDRLVRLEEPNGSFSRTEYGPWRVVEHDRNDTVLESRWHAERVGRTIDAELVAAGMDPVREAAAATQTEAHAATPSARHLDSLGRPVDEVEHAGLDPAGQPRLLHTLYRRDLDGRTRAVTDPRGITTITYRHDLRGNLLAYRSADSGVRLLLDNVTGDPLRAWDERGHEIVFGYADPLHRCTAKRVRGGDGPVPLDHVFERTVYGEGRPGAASANLRTRVALHYDTAGRTEHHGYDFKGNLASASRRFARDYKSVPNWDGPAADAALEAESFDSASSFDALGRIAERTAADGSVHRPVYNAANLLDRVTVVTGTTSTVVVKGIDYDERGERRRITLGNDVVTEYHRDPETFRLVRLVTRTPGGVALQDLHHTYDPAGNLVRLVDSAVPTVWFSNAMVMAESTFAFDALYRLTEATGREHAGQVTFGASDNVQDSAHRSRHAPGDAMAWHGYTQRYDYDDGGNLTRMAHAAPAGAGWTRDYTYAADSNRLLDTRVAGATYAYGHHPRHGYVERMPHLPVMRWNFKDELTAVASQVVSTGTPETTWYVYDGDGQRVRKVVESAAPAGGQPRRTFERYSVDGADVDRTYDASGAVTRERRTLHVMDDRERIATIEQETQPGQPAGPRLVRYHGGDLIGSSRLETDDGGRVIAYELFHPFGTTAYQATDSTIAAAAKRFRYTGMERDEESGLQYHGARFYAPWLGRWTAPDRHADRLDGNRYAYVKNNPTVQRDRNGLFEEPVHGATTYRLALAAGFTQEDAARIAIATAGMDHDAETRPGDGIMDMQGQIWLGRTLEYHFPTHEEALSRVEGEIAGGVRDLERFGRHLHSLQDVGFTDAPGPHRRAEGKILSPVVGGVGMALLAGGTALAVNADTLVSGDGWRLALTLLAGVMIAAGLYAFIFSMFASDQGHPTYTTERGELSHSFSHTADQAFQDPRENTRVLLRIYEVLRRAADAHYGTCRRTDEAAARQAIADVVAADDACKINNLLNAPTRDALGNPAPSYSDIVRRRAAGRWAPERVDVSLDRGREYRYQPGVSVCTP